mmetsp:Transcript_34224/g.65910  ORF Transcript_34224/g.65910 Transcript_34224/m.65910 type:complete len:97 (+) Transcript_34224:207-497(+)
MRHRGPDSILAAASHAHSPGGGGGARDDLGGSAACKRAGIARGESAASTDRPSARKLRPSIPLDIAPQPQCSHLFFVLFELTECLPSHPNLFTWRE